MAPFEKRAVRPQKEILVVESDTRRNVLTYYLNFVVVAVVGFVVNPILLGALGPVVFGVWKSLQRYLDFASVADGRASQALKWIVASRTNLSETEKQRDVGAAIAVWLRWLPAAALVGAGVTIAAPLLIKGIPSDAQSATYMAAAILAANTVLAGLLYVPDSVLVGVNKGYRSMLITTAVVIGSNIAMVFAAFEGWPFWALAVIVLSAAVVNGALTLLVVRKVVPWWGISRPTASDIKRVFGYSAWTLGSMLVDKLLLASELIVISVMVGAVAVTQYTFTSYVMQFVLSIALVTASGFMPILGSKLGAAQHHAAAEQAKTVRHLVIGVVVVGCGAVLAFNGTFVGLWVGKEQYLGTTVNMLLVICGLQQALIRMDGQILDVTMRIAPKVVVGLLASAGGIVAGCIGFALTKSMVTALTAVILFRLASNVAYPAFVARAIPGSAVPWRLVILSAGLLVISFWVGAVSAGSESSLRVALAVGWLLLAGCAAWFGIVPRATVGALLSRQGAR